LGKFRQIYQELKFKKQNLAGSFDVEIKVKPVAIEVDIRKTFLYRWGEKEREKRGFKKGKQEEKQEGLKEAILLDVQIKFGKSKMKELKNLLEEIVWKKLMI
jgi:predicted transposase YdaD